MVNQKYFLADLIIRKGRFVEEGYFPDLSELGFQTNLTRIQVLKITGT